MISWIYIFGHWAKVLSNFGDRSLSILDLLFQCDMTIGTKLFFDMMHKFPPKVMLFGGVCTLSEGLAHSTVHDKSQTTFCLSSVRCIDFHQWAPRCNFTVHKQRLQVGQILEHSSILNAMFCSVPSKQFLVHSTRQTFISGVELQFKGYTSMNC